MKIPIKDTRGFTFIEILIGMVILSLICMGVAGVFRQFSSTDRYVVGTLNNVRDGNVTMNRIAEELKYAEKVDLPNGPGGSAIDFNYYQDSVTQSIFLRDKGLYFNNGSGEILIAQNVNNIQFDIINYEKRIVSVNAILYDSKSKSNYQVNTNVKLMNQQEE